MSAPRVSVLMPIYNAERYLASSLDSILGQTFTDFELLAIYEPSQDQTREILRRYTDPRLHIIVNQTRLGVSKTLAKGLSLANGELIARMDADDIAFADRFQIQVNYLDQHPDIGLLGSAFQVINHAGKVLGTQRVPIDPVSICWRLLFGNCIAHPMVMFRKQVALELGGYDIQLVAGEDYDFWVRFAAHSKIAQTSQVLGQWRDHAANLSTTEPIKSKEQYIWTVIKSIRLQTGLEIDFETALVLFRGVSHPASNLTVLTQAYATIVACLERMQSRFSDDRAKKNRLVELALRDVVWLMRKNPSSRRMAIQTAFKCLSKIQGVLS
jgi:glycosyltransferase involved in cell wall biosynthesis